ncbi:MAG: type I phosphomannose isomerase catalytic subunit [Thermodesulfobacteriota bacterium]|nr:type I phosphomannose isomerase catalytic subunit [Thermodesulfobacteriota bacterium]
MKNTKNISLYPLILKPIFKEKPWGGRRLETLLGKNLPPDVPIGESWELTIRHEEKSIIANGPLAGKTLLEAGELCGILPVEGDRFPLLIKFVDAQDTLSVQVHPDDKYVSLHEDTADSGKTEMWYILHAEPGSGIIFGLKEGVFREEIRKALEEKTLKECFNEVMVKEGDVFFIPAGMVHAIGRGIVLAEIQQNSDITYRLYDWERLDSQGKPRDLHVEKALDVIDFSFTDAKKLEGVSTAEGRNKKTVLKKCPHFAVELLEINEETLQKASDNFSVLSMLEGRSTIQWGAGEVNIVKGETVFLPACLAGYRLLPDIPSRMLKTSVPLSP